MGKLVISQRAAGHPLWRVGSLLIQWNAKASTWLSTYMLIHYVKKIPVMGKNNLQKNIYDIIWIQIKHKEMDRM